MIFDNKIFKFIERVIDALILTLFWFIACIPIITIGAATTSFYYSMHKTVWQQRGYVKEFWTAFRDNFKVSTRVWLVELFLLIFFIFDAMVCYMYRDAGSWLGGLVVAFLILICLLSTIATFLFAYLARFKDDKIKTSVKNVIYMASINFGSTFGLFIILAVFGLSIYLMRPFVVVAPALMFLAIHPLVEGVFKQYLSAEQLEEEKERERVYNTED